MGHSAYLRGQNADKFLPVFSFSIPIPVSDLWAADPTFRSTSLNRQEFLLTVRELSVIRGQRFPCAQPCAKAKCRPERFGEYEFTSNSRRRWGRG